MSSRLLIYLGTSKIPRCFNDWAEFEAYVRNETIHGRPVTITKLEYV